MNTSLQHKKGGSKMGFISPNLTYEDTCNYYKNIVHTLGCWFINTNTLTSGKLCSCLDLQVKENREPTYSNLSFNSNTK